MKKLYSIFILVCAGICISSCQSGSGTSVDPQITLTFSIPDGSSIAQGESFIVTASITGAPIYTPQQIVLNDIEPDVSGITATSCSVYYSHPSCNLVVTIAPGTPLGLYHLGFDNYGDIAYGPENMTITVISAVSFYAGGSDANGNGAVYLYNASNGLTTIESGIGNELTPVASLAIDSAGLLYVGGGALNGIGALYSYNSNSSTWTTIESAIGVPHGSPVTALAISANNTVYIGAESANNVGAVYSYTGPDSWTIVESSIGTGPVTALAIPANESTLYIGGESTTGNGAVYYLSSGFYALESSLGSSAVNAIVASSDGTTLYFGGADQSGFGAVYSYHSGVLTTIESGMGAAGKPIKALAIATNGTLYAGGVDNSGTHGGLYSCNSNSCSLIATGIGSGTISSLAITSDGSKVYIGGLDSESHGGIYLYSESAVTSLVSGAGNGPVNALAIIQ